MSALHSRTDVHWNIDVALSDTCVRQYGVRRTGGPAGWNQRDRPPQMERGGSGT